MDKLKILAAALIVIASIAGYYYFGDLLHIGRVGIVLGGVLLAAVLVFTTEVGQRAWSFMRSANVERQKVVWPSRQEAMQVTLMVIVLVIILGLLMWIFDAISFYAIYDVILRVRGA
jgi:preprotein translocase subunit SecE